MKNLAKLVVAGSLFAFVACGPTAEEQAAKAKEDSIRIADSMAVVDKARQDSVNAENLKKEEAAKKVADSLHADSLVKFKKLFDKDGKLIKKVK
jgi:hypothetical protein